MTIEILQRFMEVVYQKSIRQAAARLGIPQQTLNRQIKTLENDLGVQIFECTNQGTVLTDAGKEVYQFAQWCLGEHQKLLQNLLPQGAEEPLPKRKIKIGCVDSAISNVIAKSAAWSYHYQLPFELEIIRDNSSNILAKVRSGAYDFGLILQYQDNNLMTPLIEYNLQGISLYQAKLCAWISCRNALAQGKDVAFEQLKPYTLINLQGQDEQMSRAILEHKNMDMQKLVICDNIYYALHFLEYNLGVVMDLQIQGQSNYERILAKNAVNLPINEKDNYELWTKIVFKKTLDDAQQKAITLFLEKEKLLKVLQ